MRLTMPDAPPEVLDKEAKKARDRALVERAQAGDFTAYADLVRHHQRRIYGLALGMLKNPAEAEEVVQESFLSGLKNIKDFRQEAQFSTWIYRVAVNHALMRLRKKKPAATGDLEALERALPAGQAPTFSANWTRRPDEVIRSEEVRTALDAALADLDNDARAMLLLRAFDGASMQEIADLFETTIPAVKSKLHRARLLVRDRLDIALDGDLEGLT